MQPGGPAHLILILIHVIAAVAWLMQFPIDMVMARLVRINQGKPNEATLMAAHMRVGNALGSAAGPLVLLSGFGLLYVWRFGFFGLTANTPGWLIGKQVVYVIVFIMFMAVIMPNSKRIGPLVAQLMQGAALTGVTDEQRSAYSRIINISRISAALVLLNIVLGVWQSPPAAYNIPAPSAVVETVDEAETADDTTVEEATPAEESTEESAG